jgi:hypothetical protein
MPARYRHRKNRPLHSWRHGRYHASLHRHGVRHRHVRGRRIGRPDREAAAWRSVPARLWPKEIGRQVLLGAALGLGVVLVVSAILGLFAFLDAKADLSKAQNIAKNLVDHRTLLLTADGRAAAAADLEQMHYYANEANSEVGGSLALTVLKAVPVLGYQVSALTGSVSDVDVLSAQGEALLSATINTIRLSHGTAINLPELKILDAQVHTSAVRLAGLESSTTGLWGPVQTERQKLNSVLTQVVGLLRRGNVALNFAQPFLGADGPRTYLVVGQNNSEMRDQGAVLSWALLHANDGKFTMTDAASVGTITLHSPAVSIASPTTESVFGKFDPTQIWQSVNANGNFPTSAQWMIAMFHQARGITVNGVIGVDVQTLANILKVVGPVRVPTIHQTVSASNVAPLLLYKLYLQYPAGEQVTRHDDITAVAQAAVHEMNKRKYDLGYFFDQLAKASQGRHLLFYDTSVPLEHAVVSFGGSGDLLATGTNDVHLAIEAGVAAKLDWFLHTTVTYDIRIASDGTAFYTVTVLMHNEAPAHAKPSYALGPDHTNSFIVGEYIGRLFLWLPPGAEGAGSVTEEGLSLQQAIQPVLAQNTGEVVFNAIEPNAVHHGVLSLTFVPQSLIHPSAVTVNFTSSSGYNGPVSSSWVGNNFRTLTWRASS